MLRALRLAFAGFIILPIFPLQAAVADGSRAAPPPHLPPSLSLVSLWAPCARENAVLFLEGTATCRSKGGMEPEWAVISAITCAHVTALARGPCGVNRKKAGNYRCFSFSFTESPNTSGEGRGGGGTGCDRGTQQTLQLGGSSCFLTIYARATSLLSAAT